MRYDHSPFYRTTVGFDRLLNLLDTASEQGYPPYNIERTGEESYRLTMAVAGFSAADLDLVAKDNTLVITGRVANDGPKAELLYRGIAGRPFERKFVLADHVVVDGADLQNGLLHVALKRVVPEALKPRRIPIGGVTPTAIANDPSATAQAA